MPVYGIHECKDGGGKGVHGIHEGGDGIQDVDEGGDGGHTEYDECNPGQG